VAGKTHQNAAPGSCAALGASGNGSLPAVQHDGSKRQRRKVIPEKPNYSLNLWGIMKNCVGRDLTKIPMPVGFRLS